MREFYRWEKGILLSEVVTSDDVGEWLYIYYSHATRTLDSLLAAYEAASSTQISTEGELA